MKQPKVNIPQSPLPGNDKCELGRFSKAYNELMELGLPLRLVCLYGRLEFHAGKTGCCNPRHSTLAREIGIRHRQNIAPLLAELRKLRLIEWDRKGPHANGYRILPPDLGFVKDVCKSRHLDVCKSRHRKEGSSSKEGLPPSEVLKLSVPAPEKAKPEPKKNFDDDEKTPGALTPEAEFRRRLAARDHGPLFDADRAVACVLKQLGKLGIEIREFLAFDASNTTGQGRSFTNPIGYYVALAKDYVHATRDRSVKALVAAAAADVKPPPDVPRNGHGRCAMCNGAGVLNDGGFCGCPLGKDLERVSRRGPKGETNEHIARIRQRSG